MTVDWVDAFGERYTPNRPNKESVENVVVGEGDEVKGGDLDEVEGRQGGVLGWLCRYTGYSENLGHGSE